MTSMGPALTSRESDNYPNLHLRVGQSVSYIDRMFLQIKEGSEYSTAFSFQKTNAGSFARLLLETAFEHGNSVVVGTDKALELERDALMLLKKAEKIRKDEKDRLAKLDPEVAEYRKTELTSNPITAKNFVEWENLDDAGKQGWRDRYTAVVELFKKKFDVGQNVEIVSEWESITFFDVKADDELRVKQYRDDDYHYRKARYRDGNKWMTDTRTLYGDITYYSLQRKIG